MTHATTQTPPPPDHAAVHDSRRVHSEETWASARDAYLSGETGASAAARHGISASAFWRRAAEDGWRRRDRPEDPPAPFDPDQPAMEETQQLALIDRRVSWALERGDAGESLRWLRMRDRIETRNQRRREAAERERVATETQARRENGAHIRDLCAAARDIEVAARVRLANLRSETHPAAGAGRESRESKNSTFDHPDALDPDAPGISRAERRRRLKYRTRRAGAADP